MMCFVPINQITLGLLPPAEVKNASGLYNLTRNLGGAIGLAGINTLMIQRLALHQERLAETANATRPIQPLLDALQMRIEDLMPGGDGVAGALAVLRQLLLREAMTLTFADAFLAIAGCFGVAILLLPLLRKVVAPAGPGGGGDAH
jgi:DHA2 family multidrug resistance protein